MGSKSPNPSPPGPPRLTRPEMGLPRVAQLKHLAYRSSSLDDMADAIIELIDEVMRLKQL